MTVRETFDFVTDPNITEENIDRYLEKVCPPPVWFGGVKLYIREIQIYALFT